MKAAPARHPIDAAAPPSSGTASRAWLVLAAVLAGGSLIAALLDSRPLDWQPDLALAQPWRWWSAAWVHWSQFHRWANVVGTLLVAALGWRAQCDRLDSLAWFIAWPLTHLGLLLQPALAHYGGLSGVLHAGVVIAALALLDRERGVRRALGAAIAVAVLLKIVLEHPWQAALQRAPDWDIAIAPAAHLSGAAVGAACAAAMAVWRHRRGGGNRFTPSVDR